MRKEKQTIKGMRELKFTSGISYKQKTKQEEKGQNAITLIALVVTIVLNCCEAAMERMLKNELILNI